MSRRRTSMNEHDVEVARHRAEEARHKAVKARWVTIGKVLTPLVLAATAVSIGWSTYQVNNTVANAPGGTATVTSGEVSADAGTIGSERVRPCHNGADVDEAAPAGL